MKGAYSRSGACRGIGDANRADAIFDQNLSRRACGALRFYIQATAIVRTALFARRALINLTTHMQNIIEALESRIAPAAVVTYTEADGDLVTVKTSAKISAEDFADRLEIIDGHLDNVNLDDPIFRKTDLTITVSQAGGGDGFASVGSIYAEVDLKNVVIAGDLRSIEVGDSNRGTVALSKLQVRNLGGGANNEGGYSDLNGNVNVVRILGDFTGDLDANNIKSLSVGGSIKATYSTEEFGSDHVPYIDARRINSLLIGGDMEGEIEANTIRSIRIGGNIVGGDTEYWEWDGVEYSGYRGEYSGTIYADVIKSVRVEGSILGGDDDYSGQIYADFLGTVIVQGDLIGGDGEESGSIWGDDELTKVIVQGKVSGGYGEESGQIGGYGDIDYVYVGLNLEGGEGSDSGWIGSDEGGSLERVVIGGSIVGSYGDDSGQVDAEYIGSIRVGGDLVGGDGYDSGSISAWGIGSVYIGGNLLGGYGDDSGSVFAGGIGSIRVIGNLVGAEGYGSGSILTEAGVESVSIGGSVIGEEFLSGSIVAEYGSIDAITIGGSLTNNGEDQTGIYAHGSIGRLTIGGSATGAIYGTLHIRAGSNEASVPTIGSLNIKGDATNLLIEAGVVSYEDWNPSTETYEIVTEVRPDATIGAVNIGGNFTTSSILVSVDPATGSIPSYDDNGLGRVSRIGSVAIGGSVIGSSGPSESYLIIAQHIAAAKVGGAKQTLLTGASNDLVPRVLGGSGNVFLVEAPQLPLI